jgi:hypothetical protein
MVSAPEPRDEPEPTHDADVANYMREALELYNALRPEPLPTPSALQRSHGDEMPPALMPLLYNPPEHLLLITHLMNKPNGFPVRVFWPAPEQVRRVKSQLLHPPKKKHEPTRALNRRRSTTICWVPTLASCTSQERSRTSPNYHMLFAPLSEPNLS